MAKVSKNFKLSDAAVTCINLLQKNQISKGGDFTQTEVVEQALFHYLVSVYGEKMLSDIILGKHVEL